MASNEPLRSRPPDPFVAARVHDPAELPRRLFTLAGLLGDSDRPGQRRLYLTTSLDYFAEFAVDDVVAVEAVTAEEPPFPGLDATRLDLHADATVVWVHRSRPGVDLFALDVRAGLLGLRASRDEVVVPQFTRTGGCNGCFTGTGTRETCAAPLGGLSGCPCLTDFGTVPTRVRTDASCHQATCGTCDAASCITCGEHTCQTCVAACQTRAETCTGCRPDTFNPPCTSRAGRC